MSAQAPKQHFVQLFDNIASRVDSVPLSELLPSVLRLARGIGAVDLETWARLELDGYVVGNPAMTVPTVVPKYRSVSGQYYDDFDNRLVIENRDLHFMFEDRLRFGVAEIEQLSRHQHEIRVVRTPGIDMVRKHLDVAVTSYGFPPTALSGVLSSIRSELVSRLSDLEPLFESSRDNLVPVKSRDRPGLMAWVGRHLWPIIGTIGAGLLVAYLSNLLGWV